MVKQVIVVNKGLNMSKGKMAAQVSHASMAFLTKNAVIRKDMYIHPVYDQDTGVQIGATYDLFLDMDALEWVSGTFTKVILEVKNEYGLEKIVEKAKNEGLVEDVDFFCIRDNCYTELTPDETGTRWTCIGFKPMESSKIDKVTKKLQLFKEN